MSDFSQAFADEFLDGLAPGETVVDADVDVGMLLPGELSKHRVSGLESDETVVDADVDDEAPHDHFADFARAMQGEPEVNVDQVLGEVVEPVSPPHHVPRTSTVVLQEDALDLKRRKWQIDSGQVFGPVNGETDITLKPQCLFRCEKIMATDDSSNPGAGTRILSVTVGNKVQKLTPGGNGTLTQFFAAQALANGIKFDTTQPYQTITIRVRFMVQCNFEMSIFGTSVVDE